MMKNNKDLPLFTDYEDRSALMVQKRTYGRYYTRANPFSFAPFLEWADEIGLSRRTILEPFAGCNSLIRMLRMSGLCQKFQSYDIEPAAEDVKKRDTINNFPSGFSACITNPPWLARNSAVRRELSYPSGIFDNLYKHCLELCLLNCEYVAALVPASFLQSGLFRKRLNRYVLLHSLLFADTENPVCLALFNASESNDTLIYYDNKPIGNLRELENHLPLRRKENREFRFNDPNGELGFVSFDSTSAASIRFCSVEETRGYEIKQTSRFITRISGNLDFSADLILRLNKTLGTFRKKTEDVFLTPFKGLRKDGNYRRRMDFGLAKDFLNAV